MLQTTKSTLNLHFKRKKMFMLAFHDTRKQLNNSVANVPIYLNVFQYYVVFSGVFRTQLNIYGGAFLTN